MKYGMRERVSGALILIALAVIFVPLLFDEPAPRDDRPRPVLTIEQPVEVERRDLSDPEPPASLRDDAAAEEGGETTEIAESPVETVVAGGESATDTPEAEAPAEAAASASTGDDRADPIAALARAADQRLSGPGDRSTPSPAATPGGEWVVQVGSFGEPGNAERLETRLEAQGFPAYRRARGNDLTSVYVGPYGTAEVAEDVMGDLKARLNLQGLLVRAGN